MVLPLCNPQNVFDLRRMVVSGGARILLTGDIGLQVRRYRGDVKLPPLRPLPDLLPAAALLVVGAVELIFGSPSLPLAVGLLLTATMTAPLAARRFFPLAVLLTTLVSAGLLAILETQAQIAVPLALLLATFTAGFELDLKPALIGIACVVAAFAIVTLLLDDGGEDLALTVVFYGAMWGFGQALRGNGKRVEALTERAERLELEREVNERTAAAAERTRIARELHDIVSHSISVVVLQTQAVRRRLEPEQEQEREDLRAVETTAREAMAEMRRLFGVLRTDDAPPMLAPQPGLDQLDRLLDEARAGGQSVEARIEGDRVPLAPGVDLAAFRIVQESLTNVRKHSGGANASIELNFTDDELRILVEDDGAAAAMNGPRGGHGVKGMRERAELYGGSLEVGARPAGGFRVSARLPIQEAAPS